MAEEAGDILAGGHRGGCGQGADDTVPREGQAEHLGPGPKDGDGQESPILPRQLGPDLLRHPVLLVHSKGPVAETGRQGQAWGLGPQLYRGPPLRTEVPDLGFHSRRQAPGVELRQLHLTFVSSQI